MNTGLLIICLTEEFEATMLFSIVPEAKEWDTMHNFVFINLEFNQIIDCVGECTQITQFATQLETVLQSCSPTYNNQFPTGLGECEVAYVNGDWAHVWCALLD